MTSTSKELLDILQKRLVNDKSNLISMNRLVLLDMLHVFGAHESGSIRLEEELTICRNDRYRDTKRHLTELAKLRGLLRRFACDCDEPCDGADKPCVSWLVKEALNETH